MVKPKLVLPLLIILSCSPSDEQPNQKTTSLQTKELAQPIKRTRSKTPKNIRWAYELFASAIINKDTAQLNELIHPDLGLYIIGANGALPEIVKTNSLNKPLGIKSKMIKMDPSILTDSLKIGELPATDCDAPPLFYSKSGCFGDSLNDFRNQRVWVHSNLSKQDKIEAEKSAGLITHTVINTRGFKAYFFYDSYRWSLLFIDLRVPCSA